MPMDERAYMTGEKAEEKRLKRKNCAQHKIKRQRKSKKILCFVQ